jgi:hypothetical protein
MRPGEVVWLKNGDEKSRNTVPFIYKSMQSFRVDGLSGFMFGLCHLTGPNSSERGMYDCGLDRRAGKLHSGSVRQEIWCLSSIVKNLVESATVQPVQLFQDFSGSTWYLMTLALRQGSSHFSRRPPTLSYIHVVHMKEKLCRAHFFLL